MGRCSKHVCTARASRSVLDSTAATFCKNHAEDGLIKVRAKRCFHASCARVPFFHMKGSKKPVFCSQHADDDMVNVRSESRCQATCSRRASFNLEGSTTSAYCRQHAHDGMVNVRKRRCSHHTCHKVPSFNLEGCKPAEFCKQHATHGMVNVCCKRCSHETCTKQPSWGVLHGSVGITCKTHATDIVGGPIVNFKARCEVAKCKKVSTWGPSGKQLSHCGDHGPLVDGLVITVQAKRRAGTTRSVSCDPTGVASSHVKAECTF